MTNLLWQSQPITTTSDYTRLRGIYCSLMALKAQFAGAAHWDREVKIMSDFMSNSRWTGTTAFSLHAFLAKHRASFHTLQRCAEHVQIELPNERTRVGYLLANIDCHDKDLTTALSHICLDDSLTGMRSDFERSVAFLLPTDPVKKKKGAKQDDRIRLGARTQGRSLFQYQELKPLLKLLSHYNCGKARTIIIFSL